MNAIMLSIHPQYVMKIINGTKRYEFRRRLARSKVSKIYIYETFPAMKVVAVAQVVDELAGSPSEIWERTKDFAGISKRAFYDYFQDKNDAFAYELGDVEIFEYAQNLDVFGLTSAPQSFACVKYDLDISLRE